MKTTTTTTNNKTNVTTNNVLFNFKKIKIDVTKIDTINVSILNDCRLAKMKQVDIKLVDNKKIQSEKIKLQKMIDDKKAQIDIDRQTTYIDGLIVQRDKKIKQYKQAENDARALINKDMYNAYCNNDFKKGLQEYFELFNLVLTDTTYKYFLQVVGLKNATNRQVYDNGMFLGNKGYTAFVTSILNGMIDLLTHKNVFKREDFTWEYVPTPKTPKKTKKQTDTKIKKTKKVA